MSVGVENMPDYFSADEKIRTMTYGDLQEVIQIEEKAYAQPWTIGIFRDCIRSGYNCWVITEKEMIIGYGIILLLPGEAHILNVCVHPDHQRNGIGRKILHYLLHRASRARADMVLLEVRASNQIAIQLYLSEGFNELGVRTNYYPSVTGREDAVILARYMEKAG